MVARKVIKIGSRGSNLALYQTKQVLDRLSASYPGLEFEVVVVRTSGDAQATMPLLGMGAGAFVRDLEWKLLDHQLDIAVHSLKDLPTQLPEGLNLGAMLPRQDARDVLVNRWGCLLSELPCGVRIGTGSQRRRAQLKNACRHIDVLPIRGNVETRVRKGSGEECDGVILAAAGLIRLGMAKEIAEYLPPQQFVPSPGQGVVAVEVRADDDQILNLVQTIEHRTTRSAATAERTFLELLGGGCQMPVGAYAWPEGDILTMTTFAGTTDGEKAVRILLKGTLDDPIQLANSAYNSFLEQGGVELIKLSHLNPNEIPD
jgi:hydroxymethylbilane synthase